MRGFALSVLAVILSLAEVCPKEHLAGDIVTSLDNTKQAEVLVHVINNPRHVVFRPLIATKERNRELQKRLKEQRQRLKQRNSSNRKSAHSVGVSKYLWTSSQLDNWTTVPSRHFEFVKTTGTFSRNAKGQKLFLYPIEKATVQVKGLAKRHQKHPELLENTRDSNPVGFIGSRRRRDIFSDLPNVEKSLNTDEARPSLSTILMLPESASHPIFPKTPEHKKTQKKHDAEQKLDTFPLSRFRQDTNSNSSRAHMASDKDDTRPSPSMTFLLQEPAITLPMRDAAESKIIRVEDNDDLKSSDKETMETAETVVFHPLWVHRRRKAEKQRRRQLQMRPQRRPQKPQRQQSRPPQRPATIPHQNPQQIRPQRPVQSTSQKKKKPQATRRGQYYYVAAAGQLGQWVYLPYYYSY